MSTASAEVDKDVRSGTEGRPASGQPVRNISAPEPNAEGRFKQDKFAFSPQQLDELFDPKSLSAYRALGGLPALERGLRTNRSCGLSVDETVLESYASFTDGIVHANRTTPNASRSYSRLETLWASVEPPAGVPFTDRKCVFHDNTLPHKMPVGIFRLMWMAYNDTVLFLLTAAAVISLAIGLYQTFSTERSPTNPRVQWIEGVAIIIAIIIIVTVGAVNDYERQRQFAKLDQKKKQRDVRVIRSGKSRMIDISDVLVGDVVHLEPGDVVPADGILIDGYNVRCDESPMTGESKLICKTPGDEAFRWIGEQGEGDVPEIDPFIISGTKVAGGIGTFLITATGVNSCHGKILMSLDEDPDFTPLQVRLNNLAKFIAKMGAVAALLLFVVLFIKFLVQLRHATDTPAEKGQNFLNILIISLTVLVIAVPEGLPLAVTLALAFASNKMLKDHNLVRQLKACETMGNATCICSDKTGTLTQNKMSIVAGSFGTTLQFENGFEYSLTPNEMGALPASEKNTDGVEAILPVRHFVACLADVVKGLLVQSIVTNTTAFESEVGGLRTFTGSRTETAMLTFAHDYAGMETLSTERSNNEIVQIFPFDTTRQSMGVVIALGAGRYRLHVKGASEVILGKCTRVIGDARQDISDIDISPASIDTLNQVIRSYATRSLRTISLAYREFDQWPPSDAGPIEGRENDIFENLVFFGIVGIQDPLRDGARDAVQTCQRAGVVVRMVTGDNIFTARAIAEQCGILTPLAGDIAMQGLEFRTLNETEMQEVIPRLKVLARSSPEDKRTLVRLLKGMGETVAVTGDGTNDALALKAADIGFSMGSSGTEVAREASSIVLMDDNFASIVKAIMWGRAVNDAVKQFLQFQITVSVTSVGLTFVSAVANADEQSVLTAVQLMWINLFQDTLAALALATDPPVHSVLDRKPDPRTDPLVNLPMWKMILGQSIYQLAVTLTLYFAGAAILSYRTAQETAQLRTIIFNTYVWMQIFNMYNNRKLNNRFNIFEGLWQNWFFIAISLVMIIGQIVIIFIGGKSFSTTRLNGSQWGISIILGALSIPVGVLIRLIPDKLFSKRIWSLGSVRSVTGRPGGG